MPGVFSTSPGIERSSSRRGWISWSVAEVACRTRITTADHGTTWVSSALPVGTSLGPPIYIRCGRVSGAMTVPALHAAHPNPMARHRGPGRCSRVAGGPISAPCADRLRLTAGVSQKTPVLAPFLGDPALRPKGRLLTHMEGDVSGKRSVRLNGAHPCPLASFQLRGVVATHFRKQLPVAVWGASEPRCRDDGPVEVRS